MPARGEVPPAAMLRAMDHESTASSAEGLGGDPPPEAFLLEPEHGAKTAPSAEEPRPPQRLVSLDALRGFDMFWIIGGSGLLAAIAPLLDQPWLNWIDGQVGEHVAWHGFVFWDLVFPLFLFISGAALPLSMERRTAQGHSKARLALKALTRGLLLVLLGCIYNGLLQFDFEAQRYPSVLGRIGLAWMFAAWVWIFAGQRGRVIATITVLLVYWALMVFVPVPVEGGAVRGQFTMSGNFASWVDRVVLPGRLYKGIHDPEGLMSTLPAVATALMGAFAGQWLTRGGSGLTRFFGLAGAGVVLLGVGLAWDSLFPINKNLWTSSFAVYAAGWSALLLALFYLVFDVARLRLLAFPLVVIGVNPLLIYLVQRRLIDFEKPVEFLFGGALELLPPAWMAVAFAALVLAVKWLLLLFLYKSRIFVRV